VLGKESGAFAEFVKPMKFNIMPILGSGRQMVSWIEVNDLARLFTFCNRKQTICRIYNAVAPGAVSHKEMMTHYQHYRK
jgi:NAD dependent epimerase/dehydratase family enzyme